MTTLKRLPVVPLREAVLFPGTTVPVVAGRPGTVKAVRRAEAEDSLVFVVAQSENSEQVTPERLHTIGTIARISQIQKAPGRLQVILMGEMRGIAIRYHENEDGSLEATLREVEEMLPLDPDDAAFLAMQREVRDRSVELARKSGFPDEYVQQVLTQAETPGQLADTLGGSLELKSAERQKLLETFSVEERLRRVLLHVQRQLVVVDAQQDIQSQVNEELGGRQREMFLREQLKAIQKELGDSPDSEDLEELWERLDSLGLPPAVQEEVERDFDRLTRMAPESMEFQVQRAYLETVAELPWSERSEEQLDLVHAEVVLAEDHYGLDDVKDRVLEYLAVLNLQARRGGPDDGLIERDVAPSTDSSEATDTARPQTGDATTGDPEISDTTTREEDGSRPRGPKGPILLFVGPPGVGKTSIAKSIARALGREYVRMSLGGVRDEADIRGHRRTYVGAMPGRILQGMRQAGTRNPVMLLDEVDKLGASFQGDPSSALLEVLDPAQNDTFVDHYLGVPFDLSEVLFVATANFISAIPGPLLDRMEVVEFTGYTEAEKLEIARKYLLPRERENAALTEDELEVTDDALQKVISFYTRESGVRQLQKQLGKLARKVAREISRGTTKGARVEEPGVAERLGRPRVHPERASLEDQIGVATGMYYTPVGGDIMFVEATTMRGNGQLVLTGQLGDVMKESARAVWSYAKAHAPELLIDDTRFDRDIHIHVPAGAIPKDGPSAGVTMATALISALCGTPARNDVAMTGEITLKGRVLPIGGVKEKVLGAVRAGIREFVLPAANEPDLEDLPEAVREAIHVHFVNTLNEVLEIALRGAVSTTTLVI